VRKDLFDIAIIVEFVGQGNCARSHAYPTHNTFGIGTHCLQGFQGFIGVLERMEFPVIGDAVNRATRYCDGAPPGEVLLSPQGHQRV